MKKIMLSFCISLLLLSSQSSLLGLDHAVAQEKIPPAYAKWGLLAVKETKSKYANTQIIDYLHRGRERIEHKTIEKFKLWLKGQDKEFGVFVNITFDTDTEEVLEITFTETDR